MKNQIFIILLGINLSSCGKQTAQIESKVSFLNGEFCETKEITTVVPGHYEFVPALTSYDYGSSYYDYNSGMYMSPMPREVIITPAHEELDRDYVENTQRKENQIIVNAQNTYRNADKNSQFSSRMLTVSSLILGGSLIGIVIFGNNKLSIFPYGRYSEKLQKLSMVTGAISVLPTLISLLSLAGSGYSKSTATDEIKTANLHLKNLENSKDENKNKFENEINHPKETQDKLNLDDSFMKVLLQKAQSGSGKDCPDVQGAQELFREQNHS